MTLASTDWGKMTNSVHYLQGLGALLSYVESEKSIG